MAGRVMILMGSRSDLEFVKPMQAELEALGVDYAIRIASAHKTVRHLLAIIEEGAVAEGPIVYIAVAGRSNALAGMLDANTPWPVVTCPPSSTAYGGADIFSSLRMPSGVAPLVILDPGAAALAACKILALNDMSLRARVARRQQAFSEQIVADDQALRSG